VFAAGASDTARLQQHQGQGKPGIRAALTITAAHWILQQQKPLDILYAEP
jgi:hypothetical protein